MNLDDLAALAAHVRDLERDHEIARDELHAMIRSARDAGASAYRIAAATGLSERHVGRIAPTTKAAPRS